MKAAKIDREGLPGAYRHRGSLEWLRGARRSAKRSWQRSITFADETEAPYERALTLLEMGKRTGSEPTTSEGRALLARLRAATEPPAEHREPADPASDHLPVG